MGGRRQRLPAGWASRGAHAGRAVVVAAVPLPRAGCSAARLGGLATCPLRQVALSSCQTLGTPGSFPLTPAGTASGLGCSVGPCSKKPTPSKKTGSAESIPPLAPRLDHPPRPQNQGQLQKKMVLQPSSLASSFHKRLTAAVDRQHVRQNKVRAGQGRGRWGKWGGRSGRAGGAGLLLETGTGTAQRGQLRTCSQQRKFCTLGSRTPA